MDGPVIGKLFGECLYPFCSFASQRAGYISPIAGQDMIFVFPLQLKRLDLVSMLMQLQEKFSLTRKLWG